MTTRADTGIWMGLVASFLLASLAMVQFRCRITGGFPCGDWPKDGYTWHFWPPFLLLLFGWLVAGRLWSQRGGCPLAEGLGAQGAAVSPMVGLVLAWAWYGLTGPQFHRPACTIPVICHDVLPGSVAVWSLPWILWSIGRLVRLWRVPDPSSG